MRFVKCFCRGEIENISNLEKFLEGQADENETLWGSKKPKKSAFSSEFQEV